LLLDGLSFAALTILVWGVNAWKRGLWQDDVQALGEAFRRSLRPFHTLFDPDSSPLRLLTVVPSAIAYATPYPIWALHLLSATIWLAHGLAAGWIVGLLLPGRRWTRFAAVCLTLTATSDFTAGSIVPLAYNVAALLLLASAGCALLWLLRGNVATLIASPILLAASLLTMDVAFPAVPFLILLFAWWGTRTLDDGRRRVVLLLILWSLVLVPIAVVEWSFLHDRNSYAAAALLPMARRALLFRAIRLWLDNFLPWRWALARPEWFARPAAVISRGWMVAGSLLAAALVLWRIRVKDDATPAEPNDPPKLAMLFATMALVSNAAYGAIWFSEVHYRTHILSRVWASMAVAILAGWLAKRTPRLRWAAYALVVLFVFFGTWGGIERQDFYLASWNHHQRELASIVDAAPSLRPGTVVVLRSDATSGRYLATGADYLTTHWLRLLYAQPKLETIRLSREHGSSCVATANGIDCRLRGEGGCHTKRCHAFHFRFEDLVVMDYDPHTETYHLVPSLRDDPFARGFASDAARYRPENRIIRRAWSVQQERLLLERESHPAS
jgi:hypothetical protein